MKHQNIIFILSFPFLFSITSLAQNDIYNISTLHTLILNFTQSDWWQQLENNAEADENIIAALTYENEVLDSVGVHFRGMTSYRMTNNSKKKSFNIEIDWVKKQSLMGYEELNLINCFNDPTFMREVLYSNICRQVLPSAKVNFIKLEINGENWGIYANVQQLDGKFINDWFPSNDGTRWRGGVNFGNGGNIEPGGGGPNNIKSALNYLGADTTNYAIAYEIKNTRQENPWESLIHTCDVLNNTPLEQLPVELPKVLDVDRALWLCAFEILFNDNDGYVFKSGSDYYLYDDPETGRIHLIQYDANECMLKEMMMGNGPRENQQWSVFYKSNDSGVPIMYRLMQIPEYRQRYLAHVRSILKNYLNEEYLFNKIDAHKELIEYEVKQDSKKLYSNQQFDSGIEELKSFIQDRIENILNNAEVNCTVPEIVSVKENISDDSLGQKISITSQIGGNVPIKKVNIFVLEGESGQFTPYAMFDDGLHGDGDANDSIYGIELPVYAYGTVLKYYVQVIAADDVGTMTFEPFAENLAYKHVVMYNQSANTAIIINELMTQNNATITDPQGEFDDWIELKNISNETVDISGMFLSDNLTNPLKWKIPDSTKLESQKYLVIWADEDGSAETGLHANFKLSADGETLLLFDSDGNGNVLLDSVTFPAQTADYSYGRYPEDVSGQWLIFSNSTPGTQNNISNSITDNSDVPEKYALLQNYPNPFNPSTIISYQLAFSSNVTLRIYDILGREITTLVNEFQSSGEYSVNFYVETSLIKPLATGIYFYRLQAGSFVDTKKMMVLK
jgi:spore coat protein CotH